MGTFREKFRKNLKTYIIAFIISLLVGVAVFLIYFFTQEQSFVACLNGTGVGAAVIFAAGALVWLNELGAFDTLSYGFKQAASSMFAKEANQYNDFVSYKDEKRIQRENSSKSYFAIFAAGLLFLIAFIVLEIVKSTLY